MTKEEQIKEELLNMDTDELLEIWNSNNNNKPIFRNKDYNAIAGWYGERDNYGEALRAMAYGMYDSNKRYCYIDSNSNIYSIDDLNESPFDLDDLACDLIDYTGNFKYIPHKIREIININIDDLVN